ncbi:MAG: GGDEF domain-containing protein [Clostridiaceae bacterium]|nr:GGDEF domain-containing protein [Clostridiaceae bacterium]
MEYLVQFQINVYALTILLVIFLYVQGSKIMTFSRRLIKLVLITTTIAIIDEPLTWIFDRMMFPGAYFLEYSTNFILILIGPVIGGLLMSYVDYRLFRDPHRINSRFYYQHASLLTLGLLLLNFYQPVYFSINRETNGFSSGDYKWIHYVLLGLLYIYMLIFVSVNQKKATHKEILLYFLCFLFPVAGMLVQLLDSKLHFSWTSIVLGLLAIYIFLETTSSDQDYLTKLYNRRSFETHLQYLMQGKKPFGLVVFDLNFFKEINDQHGHKMGDEILVNFARDLKQSFAGTGLAVRLGGDEFAVIVQSDDIEKQISQLSKLLNENSNALISNLSYSYGYQEFVNGMSADTLYSSADHKMYRHKQQLKSIVAK